MKKIWFAAIAAAATCVASFDSAQAQSFSAAVKGENKVSFADRVKEEKQEKSGASFADRVSKGMRSLMPVDKPTFSLDVTAVDDSSTELVNVDMDRADKVYHLGDYVQISVTSTVDGYLYLFSVDSKGKPILLLPNKRCADNKIAAKKTQVYPTDDMNFNLEIVQGDGTFGKEKVVAYVTEKPLRSLKNVELGAVGTALRGDEADEILKELGALVKQNVENRKGGIDVTARERTSNAASVVTVGECVYTTVGEPRGTAQRQSVKQAKRIVFSVGLNKYQDRRVPTLSLCANDANTFAKVAQNYMGVAADAYCVLTNEEANLATVRNAICNVLPEMTEAGDEIFIYWSGHGGRMATEMNAKNDAYLITYDGDLDNPVETMLTEDMFGKWIQNSLKGRRVMLFVDACHSGGLLENGGSKGFATDVFARSKSIGGDGVYVLASSCAEQFSYEARGDVTLSVMTHFLVDAIKKGDSTLTHNQLKGLVQGKTQDYVDEEYDAVQMVVDYDGLRPVARLIRD